MLNTMNTFIKFPIKRYNRYYVPVSQLIEELPVDVGLVYALYKHAFHKIKKGNLITLRLKVSEQRMIEITNVDESSIYVMVNEKREYPYPLKRKRIISYEAVNLQEGNIFDLESYLQSKGPPNSL